MTTPDTPPTQHDGDPSTRDSSPKEGSVEVQDIDQPAIAPGDADADAAVDTIDVDGHDDPAAANDEPRRRPARAWPRNVRWSRVLAYGVLPALALLLALAAGFFKWQDTSNREANVAGVESVQAAKDAAVAMLSYKPDTVDKQLGAARNLLTGPFQDSYASLVNDVVIPGARQKQISATATVAAAAPISADLQHAEALVMVNQTIVVGTGAPSDSTSSVKVGLTKVDGRWLVNSFDPT